MREWEEWERRRLEATVRTAALCAYVDGHLADSERERLCECIATYAANEGEAQELIAMARSLPEVTDSPKSGFRSAQMEWIKKALTTNAEREHAFFLAVQVANAHEDIGIYETNFLLNLMTELGIQKRFAKAVMHRARVERNSRASE